MISICGNSLHNNSLVSLIISHCSEGYCSTKYKESQKFHGKLLLCETCLDSKPNKLFIFYLCREDRFYVCHKYKIYLLTCIPIKYPHWRNVLLISLEDRARQLPDDAHGACMAKRSFSEIIYTHLFSAIIH